ncbi:hypothetical protein FIV42_13250 [Persicimonas caeni]|uniref:O-antigen polysaccharide polymerase Wzy n=1 Tax=Persicimonas caeni TaxID=2292766 RepID=A0A4Y6PTN7_PERCE|nr:hypothetical protein [Persicimonas caeni]QDG51681.1 hypothetical protein FIV42_13250 [Persicimonas caeni]QED32902.1 hypothetical protein FRD00_13245 [Persicimonas caeni]
MFTGRFSIALSHMVVGVALYRGMVAELVPDRVGFISLTLLLLVYLGIEIWFARREHPSRWLVNPAVMASFATFALTLGFTNFVLFVPEVAKARMWQYQLFGFQWLSLATLMGMVAAFGMWTGFHLNLGKRLGVRLRRSSFLIRVLHTEVRLRWWFVIAGIVASVGSRLLLVQLGAFGYSADISQLYALGPYLFYINLFADLGMLSLVGIALYYFASDYPRPFTLGLLLGVLGAEIFFGLLSGFKGAVVMPIIVVGVCYYIVKGRVPKMQILAAFALVFLAYQIVEPFRQLRVSDSSFDNQSASYLTDTITGIASGKVDTGYSADVSDTAIEVLARKNTTAFAAMAMRAKEDGVIKHKSQVFQRDLLLSPAYAVIPRLIWRSKPTQDIGEWYNRVVLGNPFRNAVGMSPVGYLYIAGGALAVLLGFLVLGLTQRVLLEGFLFAGAGGVIVFLGLLDNMVRIDNAFYAVFVEMIRYVPLLFVAQLLLFRRAPSHTRREVRPGSSATRAHLTSMTSR